MGVNIIMPRENSILEQTLQTQRRIGRLIQHNHGMSFKYAAAESGIPYSTFCSYFSQEKDIRLAELPMSNFVRLVGVIPDELLSHLLDPVRRALVPVNSEGDPDYDAIGQHALDLGMTVAQSRSPSSPGGTNIVPIERNAIDAKLARVTGRAA
jgi:hypothetical protein